MFEKILVGNRGEIALRIIRACRTLGIKVAVIFSDADAASLHVKMADEAYPIGGLQPSESYLNGEKIVETAIMSGSEAIHPGYGFLSEDSEFAALVRKQNLKFIGPSPETLAETGNKLACREAMQKVGVPVIPGGVEIIEDESLALGEAERIGYPILVKSAFGGGGRGIRIVRNVAELRETFHLAQGEAKSAFGKSGVYLEKYIEKARHIEFQILADQKGKTVHLGERECSVQRRYQKLIELSPSPVVTSEIRDQVGKIAIRAAQAVKYTNAGTIEFLRDDEGRFMFIEVNARLQVEHPVTEFITSLDLVKEQILIASGHPLSVGQEDIVIRGHAMECRINAEDPYNDFAPSGGVVKQYHAPSGSGVRVDSGLYSGYLIPIYYDSLVSKVIVHAATWEEASAKMWNVLREYVIMGVATTIPLHRIILRHPSFIRGDLSTDFIERHNIIENLFRNSKAVTKSREEIAAVIASIHLQVKSNRVQPAPSVQNERRSAWRVSAQPCRLERFSDLM